MAANCQCIVAPCNCGAPFEAAAPAPALIGAPSTVVVEFPWLGTGPEVMTAAPAGFDPLGFIEAHQTAFVIGTGVLAVVLLLRGGRRR